MSRPISSTLLEELAKSTLRPFLLISTTINDITYRYTDCDVPIVYDGETYLTIAFTIGAIQYSIIDIVDSMDVTFDNVGLQLYTSFIAGEAQGSDFTVRIVLLDEDYQIIDEENVYILFDGFIDEWTMDEMKIQVRIVNIFTTWKQKTLSRHPASCRWKVFGGEECKYPNAQDTTCDRSYARCIELDNESNFGGFRHLPDLEDKELWWGRAPKAP